MHHACFCSLMHSSLFTVTLSNLHHWLLSAPQLSASAALPLHPCSPIPRFHSPLTWKQHFCVALISLALFLFWPVPSPFLSICRCRRWVSECGCSRRGNGIILYIICCIGTVTTHFLCMLGANVYATIYAFTKKYSTIVPRLQKPLLSQMLSMQCSERHASRVKKGSPTAPNDVQQRTWIVNRHACTLVCLCASGRRNNGRALTWGFDRPCSPAPGNSLKKVQSLCSTCRGSQCCCRSQQPEERIKRRNGCGA